MASKAKTGEAAVKELARKDFNKKCFDCGRGVSASQPWPASALAPVAAQSPLRALTSLSPSPVPVAPAQGPQQNVNLTLNTFVCTSCSGLLSASLRPLPSPSSLPRIHRTAPALHGRLWPSLTVVGCRAPPLCVPSPRRNFNMQVKTINMYTFKPAEVTALEEGGNKKAAKYWLYSYDAENPREYRVDMEDPKSVLDWMKLKYEAKKWSAHSHRNTAHHAPLHRAMPAARLGSDCWSPQASTSASADR